MALGEHKSRVERTLRLRIAEETSDWKSRIKQIPQTLEEIVEYYTRRTESPFLREHLNRFLTETRSIPGLKGFVLAIVTEGPFKFLEVYFFSDPRDYLMQNKSFGAQATMEAVKAHSRFANEIHPHKTRSTLSTHAWFVNTNEGGFLETIPSFLDSLSSDDPWNFNSENTQFSHFTFIQINKHPEEHETL